MTFNSFVLSSAALAYLGRNNLLKQVLAVGSLCPSLLVARQMVNGQNDPLNPDKRSKPTAGGRGDPVVNASSFARSSWEKACTTSQNHDTRGIEALAPPSYHVCCLH